MYANLKASWLRNKTLNLLTLGEHMKKILLFLLMALGVNAYAVSTLTPTPTLSPTPTFTLTPTRTNTPVSGFGDQKGHVIVHAKQFLQADGFTAPALVADPGGITVYMAFANSQTAAVFTTGSAQARVVMTVPADYQRNGALWVYATNSSLTNTVALQADIARISFGALTSTGNVYVGVSTNVQTQFTGPLLGARFSRVWVPLSNTVGTQGTLKPGDLLNILLSRTGTSGDLSVYAAEFEYSVNYPLRP